jgi:hypothetical protein
MTPLTLSIPEAGALLGLSRVAAYRAAKAGSIPLVKLRRFAVPVAKLEELIGQPLSAERIRQAQAEARKAN